VPVLEINQNLERLLAEAQRALQRAVVAKKPAAISRADELRLELINVLTAARENPVADRGRADKLQEDFIAYFDHAKATALRLISKDTDLATGLDEMDVGYQALMATLRRASQESAAAAVRALAEVRSVQRSIRWLSLGATLACMVLLAISARNLIDQILKPLGKLTRVAQKIATEGDLTQPIPVKSNDEVRELASAFATVVQQFRGVYMAIDVAVQKLAATATQIFAASQEQEAASQTQSSGAEEVNRTMQSLLESATHIAESASGVFANAERAKETSAATSEKIAELSAQTARMVEILEVIREIADRSDLLALNASLEGMRAGEAGRGFSLVANEMRRLSERVNASVRDVKSLVTDVRAAGASTVAVTEEARKLAEGTAGSAKQITLVTQQQRNATELVSTNMKQVADVLEQTVCSNRQTKQAAEDLFTQAKLLTELVKRFKIEPEPAKT
jgi:methyl-accepting chemotaxis protein